MDRAPTLMRPYEPTDREGLDRLWSDFFGDWSAEQLWKRWHWQFEGNPFAKERAPLELVLSSGDRVVGFMGALPLPLRSLGRRRVTLCGTGFVVEEDFRMHAFRLMRTITQQPPVMGSSMSEAARALFLRMGGEMVPLASERFTFPLRPDGAALIRVRQRLRRPLVRWARPWMVAPVARYLAPAERRRVKHLPPAPREDGSVRPVHAFGAEYEALWSAACERFENSLDKTALYMSWRYLQCPCFKPLCFARYDAAGNMLGLVVALRRAERDWTSGVGAVHGEIAELILQKPDPETARVLLLTAMHALDRKRVDTITTTGLERHLHPVLETLGFDHDQTEVFGLGFILGSLSAEERASLSSDSWYVSGGDGETIYAVCV